MAKYYFNEAAMDLPERPFVDKTVHGLEHELPNGKTLGILVHRRPVAPGPSLRELVDEHVTTNQRRLLGYEVLREASVELDGLPALRLDARFRREGATFYQAQVHVLFGGKAMIFAAAGPAEERALCDETLARLVETFAWRAD